MPLLPLSDELLRTTPFDAECAALADRHYSRQTPGSNQFMGNGKKIVLRDNDGSVVFGWLWSEFRNDGERGYNCAIFRNESDRVASETILECEALGREGVGAESRVYVHRPGEGEADDGARLSGLRLVLYRAGWHFVKVTNSGKHLLEKELR
jgi:hypothetical protein